jgi:biopolymer transport protein TolR
MGMNVGSGKKNGVKEEINITPLIDVVLVLLIIFMVLVPASLEELAAAVPRKVESSAAAEQGPQLVLAIGDQGELALNGEPIAAGDLAAKMKLRLTATARKVVFFDVADRARYGAVVRVMDVVKGAGGTLAIVTRE